MVKGIQIQMDFGSQHYQRVVRCKNKLQQRCEREVSFAEFMVILISFATAVFDRELDDDQFVKIMIKNYFDYENENGPASGGQNNEPAN